MSLRAPAWLALLVTLNAAADDGIEKLKSQPVSMLDWGIYRLEAFLAEFLNIDLATGGAAMPPFQVDVMFDGDAGHIIIEVARTYAKLAAGQMQGACRNSVEQVRGLLNLDKLGRPLSASDGVSNLEESFFRPHGDSATDAALGQQLDDITYVQALVTAPVTGGYAVCRAGLRDESIRYF